ncbi:hypothetical protein [Alteribacillus sp. YIM 98480]|uniref:hypothetical protein n=1 Tax=Alteribacillus sp. YIM 98480 TaxID=2606599 RepID=UPI00131B75F4|nr:hypothetical protein [Alteribacillus sp. YIM 98480]
MTKLFYIALSLIYLFFIVFNHTSLATHERNKESELSFQHPDNFFSDSTSTVEILHISDDDEYLLEWTGSSETYNEVSFQQGFTLLFEDGYLKDTSSAWSEHQNDLNITKQTKAEESSRYHLLTFHYAEEDSEFSFVWSEDKLYVLDTPMTDMHSFKDPRSKEDEKAKNILDAVIEQQQDHIERIIREEANLPHDTLLFPLEDLNKWKMITDPASNNHLPLEQLEEMWGGIYKKLLEGNRKYRSENKRGMPFISWDEKQRKLSLFIHYSHF